MKQDFQRYVISVVIVCHFKRYNGFTFREKLS